MSEDKDVKKGQSGGGGAVPAGPAEPSEGEDRTVYMPSGTSVPGSGTETPPSTPASEGAPPPDEDRTVYRPPNEAQGDADRTVYQAPPGDGAAPVQPTVVAGTGFGAQFAPRTDGRAIQIGDVLNHIFEVRRFIARGGMGEVFEGVNVNTDERVAIKVMLPALAADANVIAMFRKEARTLTRLQHEALVQYRVLAQEPQLGVLYIVTEYIDGTNLADVLGTVQPTPDDLKQLLGKLAAGLKVAHSLGAVHRDISPDNVLLEDGKLSGAKIIDFGIAKDLDPGAKTIIGDGFAGKLNYVAPEQLGDFGREMGPWTDVYSLALVILAVAMGKNVQMGGSLVDAVDKRRAGPDLSVAPAELRPVLEKMLKPDPKDRLRSMDEVLKELGHGTVFVPQGEFAVAPPPRPVAPLIVGGVVAALLAAGAGWYFLGGGGAPAGDPVRLATTAVNQTLPSVECSWLDIAGIQGGDPLSVRMTGVAGNPTGARSQISKAVTAAGVTGAMVNFEEVAIIRPQGCSALQAFGQIRRGGERHMSVAQREFEMTAQPAGSQYPVASQAAVTLRPPPGQDFALLGIEPNGELSEVIPNRQAFDQAVAEGIIAQPRPGEFTLPIDMNHTGWSGLVLITGDGPFDGAVTHPPLDARGQDWQGTFVATASERDWKSEMIWFKSVDKQPN